MNGEEVGRSDCRGFWLLRSWHGNADWSDRGGDGCFGGDRAGGCAELAAQGARVVINARRAEVLAQVAAEINAKEGGAGVGGGGAKPDAPVCVAVAGDCAEQGVIDSMLNTARRTFGSEADLIVVNAGRGLNGSVLTPTRRSGMRWCGPTSWARPR